MPATYVPATIADLPPMRLLLAGTDDEQPDFGTTLDGQLRPGLALTVVAAIDIGEFTPAGPPVQAVELRTRRVDSGTHETFPTRWVAGEVTDPAAVGAAVVSPRGTATVNTAGRFVIAAAADDELVIETEPPTTFVVPAEGGVRV